jgi:circadian clock protein KaiC
MTEIENVPLYISQNHLQRMLTGIQGLDDILNGGLISRRTYLLHGSPGTGKTMVGMHFLTTGLAYGETALFITMGEPEEQLRANAVAAGFDPTGIQFLDLTPSPDFFSQIQTYDIFSPADVEREPTTERITSEVELLKPIRVFVDAITHFRYLSNDSAQFRRQVHSFLRFLVENGATVLFTSESSEAAPDDDLQYMSDGIIKFEHYRDKRTLSVIKFRGSDFVSGVHSMRITDHGVEVYPRLLPSAVVRQEFTTELISSGVPELDELINGGLERGTIAIITGPSGVGKTTLGMQFMKEAAGRGERSVIYTFEEMGDMLVRRSEGINMPVRTMINRGTLSVVQVEPLRYTPDEFAAMVRRDVELNGAALVMLDSVSGYRLTVQNEDLISNLHALSKYLQSMGVTVILINEIEDVVGEFRVTNIGISYIADTVLFLRYIELRGELRRAIGVLKKRLSNFEKSLREFEISRYGLKVGKPLTDLRGILSGIPTWDSTENK